MPRLTKRTVDALKPSASERFVWDNDLPGFGVRVYPSGTRKYLVQWKRDGRTRRLVLGRHGPVTCEQARGEALEVHARVQRGEDPAAERDARRRDLTVAMLAELWLAEHRSHKRATTLAMDRSRIEAHVKPLLGRVRLNALTRTDVERFVRDVASGKTARDEGSGRGRRIIRGGPGVAVRALGMLSAMLAFAVTRELRSDNPAEGVRGLPGAPRERLLSPAELARLGEALATTAREGEPWQAVGLVRLLALTGMRRDEARTLRWEHLDLTGGRVTLPATKTGRSHRPLAGPALVLLAELREQDGSSPWVFPAIRGSGPFVNVQKAWSRIRTRAGLEDVRLHDLRHNLASAAVASGESLFITGKVLGHAKARSTERYAHLADDPLRAAADRAAARIAAGLAPLESTAPVIPLPKDAKRRRRTEA